MTVSQAATDARPKSDDVIFEVRDASVTFEMDNGVSRVLNGVDADVHRNEILGVVGESGSGKSMFASALLNAIVEPGELSGEITYYPESGEPVDIVNLEGEALREVRWEQISMVFQGAMTSFNPTINVRKHFVETLEDHDYDVEAGMAHAKELLSDLYLDPDRVLESYPHELSGGMKQRALIALSLVLDPEVLVMDEPTAALDLLMQRSILRLLQNVQEKYDLTVVFITHDLPLVAGLCDRIGVLYAFEFVELGSAQEVVENPTHPYTRSLLRAVPNLDAPLSEMRPIDGSIPPATDIPSGCSYHPRCPLADERCHGEDPAFVDVTTSHAARCFHWEHSADEIPLEFEAGESEPTATTGGEQSAEPVVSLDDVAVHFEQGGGFFGLGEPEIVHAVDGVDLDVYGNDVVVLVGESGCGKTTLGKTAIGAQRPTSGTVSYRGQDIWEANDRGRFDRSADEGLPFGDIRTALQMIHQDPGASLNPNKTVMNSLEVPLEQAQPELDREARQARILKMLDYVGLTPAEGYARRYPHQLSGGEQQRVALIRALSMSPDLILADEAVSALDVSLRIDMMDLMLELQELFDTSYLFVSHNLSNARYFAGMAGGRIGVMYLGELVEIGPAETVIENPKHPYTKVLKWSTEDLDTDDEVESPPVRGVDIPDPVNPPSGCRFHTRCPEAREVCRQQAPEPVADEIGHSAACFREYDDHPYWESDSIVDGESE